MDSFQIHENGTFDSTDPTIYFNVSSSLTKDSSNGVESLLSYIQASVPKFAGQRPKRVFTLDGTEIKMMTQLRSGQHLFISFGEDYRQSFGRIRIAGSH